jgi:hypothetical protein
LGAEQGPPTQSVVGHVAGMPPASGAGGPASAGACAVPPSPGSGAFGLAGGAGVTWGFDASVSFAAGGPVPLSTPGAPPRPPTPPRPPVPADDEEEDEHAPSPINTLNAPTQSICRIPEI